MRLLLDTHVVLWALADPAALTRRWLAAIQSAENEVLVSAASVWEIAIKQQLGKLELPGPASKWLPMALEETGFETLAISDRHALAAGELPPHHRDPFDRMLVAQALSDGLTLVSRDGRLAPYGVALLPA